MPMTAVHGEDVQPRRGVSHEHEDLDTQREDHVRPDWRSVGGEAGHGVRQRERQRQADAAARAQPNAGTWAASAARGRRG